MNFDEIISYINVYLCVIQKLAFVYNEGMISFTLWNMFDISFTLNDQSNLSSQIKHIAVTSSETNWYWQQLNK